MSLAGRLVLQGGVKLVGSDRLDGLSPAGERLDVRSELQSGFPYKLPHASIMAELLASCINHPGPKKGLIVDLDDTIWRGTLGEEGVEGITWDLDHHSHMHGVFQQLLGSLAETGVLIGVASKNDPALVEQAFARDDLILSKDYLFPVEANWGPKSDSVARILRTWNVGADSVVFVDDSSMEVAEVEAAHPQVECIRFPVEDDQAIYQLILRLRDIFGKDSLSDEDSIRLESIRTANSPERQFEIVGQGLDKFLEGADAQVTFGFTKDPLDPRALDLVNKTNQFNLNGRRFDDGQWRSYLGDPETFLLIVAYRDKYGPLGKIAVLSGKSEGKSLTVDTWVMSCRAFTRRVEHKCLDLLFQRFQADEIVLDFLETPRNQPVREFIRGLADGGGIHNGGQGAPVRLIKGAFLEKCPQLYHRATESFDG